MSNKIIFYGKKDFIQTLYGWDYLINDEISENALDVIWNIDRNLEKVNDDKIPDELVDEVYESYCELEENHYCYPKIDNHSGNIILMNSESADEYENYIKWDTILENKKNGRALIIYLNDNKYSYDQKLLYLLKNNQNEIELCEVNLEKSELISCQNFNKNISEEDYEELLSEILNFDDKLINLKCVNYQTIKNFIEHENIKLNQPNLQSKDKTYEFNKSYVKSIEIFDQVKIIDKFAFSNYKHLTTIEIPNSVEKIESWAFYNCSRLEYINLPKELKEISNVSFKNCQSLKSIEIPDSVEKIGNCAFWNCFSLKNIKLPSNLKLIDDFAFWNCSSLKSIEIPDSVEEISEFAFKYCESLESITIPNSIQRIGEHAFYGCKNLKSITIPEKFKHRLEDFGIDESKVNVEFTKSNEMEM